jgi:hypothetical protein
MNEQIIENDEGGSTTTTKNEGVQNYYDIV